jgi:hypothetical protein
MFDKSTSFQRSRNFIVAVASFYNCYSAQMLSKSQQYKVKTFDATNVPGQVGGDAQ